ncbi:MAG: succinate--CoA ligase subunit alpha [Pseudomonadota bacterium]
MSIIIDEKKKILIQGITGREGSTRAKLMKDYGSNVVAGCTPGKGGQEVNGIPVFDTAEEAVEETGQIDISVIFVPAPLVKEAALEAFDAKIPLAVIIPDRVPIHDVLEISERAKKLGFNFIGPNTLGVLSPGKGLLGMIGGKSESAKHWFKKGKIGVVSRSGGMTSSLAYYLNQENIGQTTIVHVGGDAIIGMPIADVMLEFEKDPETEAMVMFGEIGTSQEEEVARLVKEGKISKKIIAYIGGKAAKEGTRFSHAGAIIEGNKGSYHGKVSSLKEAGVHVVENFNDIPKVTKNVLGIK